MVFCSVSCWEAHLPLMRHREAAAVERTAPSMAAWEAEKASEQRAESASSRRVVAAGAEARYEASGGDEDIPYDLLIVVSKLKKYIRARSGMNTSDSVTDALSAHVRRLCDEAIRNAGRDGRRTVLDRDIPAIPPDS